jgi:hypothetical protein
MQTFLPYPSFEQSAKCLDYRRLGKQRVEARQLIAAIEGKTKGWRNHPAAIMWRDYKNALIEYSNIMITEWINRGYNNTMKIIEVENIIYPYWFGDNEFHASHRSNLLRKDKKWYCKFDWKENDDLPYIWPKQKF